MTLSDRQREVLDGLDDFSQGTFLQPQYAIWLVPRLRELRNMGQPISPDAAEQWAREREWSERNAAFLAGIVWTVKYSDEMP